MLGLVGVGEHLLKGALRARPQHHQPHGETRSLASDSVVREKDDAQVLVQLLVARGHPSEAEAEARAVLDRLVVVGVAQRLGEVLEDALAVVGVDQPQRVQRPALREGRGRDPGLREVLLHHVPRVVDAPLVHHADARGGRELGPVCRPLQPVHVLRHKRVHRGAAVHDRVGEDGRLVGHRVARLDRRLDVVEEEHVGLVVAVQELEVDPDRRLARQDLLEFRYLGGKVLLGGADRLRGRLLHLRVAARLRARLARLSAHHGLGHALGIHGLLVQRLRQRVPHLAEEVLHVALAEVERDLVRHDLLVDIPALHKLPQQPRDSRGVLEEHPALRDMLVVRDLQLPVHLHQDLQHLVAEGALGDEGLARLQRVRQRACAVRGRVDALLEFVEAARLEGDADRLLDVALLEAPVEHALHDRLQPGINGVEV
mmetsp:Transcript_62041/g.147836  ORF Transcript_62041/g.147836 Transcript_62041/m.147836 type:complete len:428 (+) Transcript_62041:1394-2677(+)